MQRSKGIRGAEFLGLLLEWEELSSLTLLRSRHNIHPFYEDPFMDIMCPPNTLIVFLWVLYVWVVEACCSASLAKSYMFQMAQQLGLPFRWVGIE